MSENNHLTRAQLLRTAAGAGVLVTVGGVPGTASGAVRALRRIGSPAVTRGGTLILAISDASAQEKLDPTSGNPTANSIIRNAQVYQSLTLFDDRWNLQPVLARAWELKANGREWVFHLRPGVKFHDGSPMTSADVVYSLKRNFVKSVGSNFYSRLSLSVNPSGITAPDPMTVSIKLKSHDPFLPLAMGSRYAVVMKAGTEPTSVANVIGTGPFKLSSWSAGESWKLEKNEGYWETGLPYLDGVQATNIPEQSTKITAVLNGNAHMGDFIQLASAEQVSASPNAKLLVHHNRGYVVVVMDQTQKPFTDAKVVSAVKLAQDRHKAVDIAVSGHGSVTGDVPAPRIDPFYPPAVGLRPQNIAAAKKLLAQAGYPNGIDLDLYVSALEDPNSPALAQVFQQTVAPAGIRVHIHQVLDQSYFTDVLGKKSMYVDNWIHRHPSEELPLLYANNPPLGENKLKDPVLDALTKSALLTDNAAKQTAIYRKAYQRVAEVHGTAIPYFADAVYPLKKSVQGVELNLQRFFLLRAAYVGE